MTAQDCSDKHALQVRRWGSFRPELHDAVEVNGQSLRECVLATSDPQARGVVVGRLLQRLLKTIEGAFHVALLEEPPAFNEDGASLQALVAGDGRETVEHLVGERKKPFESFEDLEARGKVANPMKVVIGRILHELQDPTEKYHIFVRPPAKEEEAWRGPRRM